MTALSCSPCLYIIFSFVSVPLFINSRVGHKVTLNAKEQFSQEPHHTVFPKLSTAETDQNQVFTDSEELSELNRTDEG